MIPNVKSIDELGSLAEEYRFNTHYRPKVIRLLKQYSHYRKIRGTV